MVSVANDPPLGTRIRKRRQELGLTQKELAGKVGVDESSVINWEKDKHFPRRKLGALEQALGISLSGGDQRTLSAEELESRLQRTESALQRALDELRTGPGNGKRAS